MILFHFNYLVCFVFSDCILKMPTNFCMLIFHCVWIVLMVFFVPFFSLLIILFQKYSGLFEWQNFSQFNFNSFKIVLLFLNGHNTCKSMVSCHFYGDIVYNLDLMLCPSLCVLFCDWLIRLSWCVSDKLSHSCDVVVSSVFDSLECSSYRLCGFSFPSYFFFKHVLTLLWTLRLEFGSSRI